MGPLDRPLDRRRFLRTTGLALGGGLLSAACGSANSAPGTTAAPAANDSVAANDPAWAKVVDAANAEGSLQVWSVLNTAHNTAVKDAFQAAYPKIALTFATFIPAEIQTRVEAERSSNLSTVDVLLNTDRSWHAKHLTDGYWKPITGPDALAADKLVRGNNAPSTNGAPIATQALYDDDTRLITLFGPWGYAWNTDAVDGDLRFTDLFTSDTYRDRLGIIDPGIGANTVTLMGRLNSAYPGLFARLGSLKPTLAASAGALGQALAAGNVDVAFPLTEGSVPARSSVKFAYDTTRPVPATATYAEILASSTRPNAAQVFVNWLMTPSGQQPWCTGYASVLPNIPGVKLSAAQVEVFEVAAAADTKKTLDALNAALGR